MNHQFRCDCVAAPRCSMRLEVGNTSAIAHHHEGEDNRERVVPFRIAGETGHNVPTVWLDRAGLKSLIALLGKKVETLDGK